MELTTLTGSAVGAVALIVISGIPPLIARATTPATTAEGAAGLVRSLVMFATLVFLVPLFEKIFGDFGAEPPLATAWIFRASHTAGSVWLPMFLLVFASETLVFYLLHRNPERRRAARRISIGATIASSLALLLISAGIAVPLWGLIKQVG